jgi:GNAT superfamily N-acetyltransferase
MIKEPHRGQGHGRALYEKIEEFARRINVDYIQLDSEVEAVGFWLKMGYRNLDKVYYKNKKAMIKEV